MVFFQLNLFLFFLFYEKDHTEFTNKMQKKLKKKRKKQTNNNLLLKKQNRSLAFPSVKIVWPRPPVSLEGGGG